MFSFKIICIALALSCRAFSSPTSDRNLAINYEVPLKSNFGWSSSAASPNGGAVICAGASVGGSQLICLIYDAYGGQVGNEIKLPSPVQVYHSVSMLSDDNFVVVWPGNLNGVFYNAYFQVFSMIDGSSLMTGPVQVDDDIKIVGGTDNKYPHASLLANGYILFVGALDADGSDSRVWGRLFTTIGAPVTASFQVDSDIIDVQYGVRYAQGIPLGTQGFAVSWQSDTDIYLRYFDKKGRPSGHSILIANDPSKWPSGGDYYQTLPCSIPLSNGNLIVAWAGNSNNWNNQESFFKIYDPRGNQVTKAIMRVTDYYLKSQNYQSSQLVGNNPMAQLLNGSIIMVWEQSTSCSSCARDQALVWRILSVDGKFLGPLNTLVNSTIFPYQAYAGIYSASVAARGDGGWFITYRAQIDSSNKMLLYGICFDANGKTVPWSFPALSGTQSGSLSARGTGKWANWATRLNAFNL